MLCDVVVRTEIRHTRPLTMRLAMMMHDSLVSRVTWLCFAAFWAARELRYHLFKQLKNRNIGNKTVQSSHMVSLSVLQLLVFLHFADQMHQDPVPLFCPLH